MLPPPGPSSVTVAAREQRAKEAFARARNRVLHRHRLNETDIPRILEDPARISQIGSEIKTEWLQEPVESEIRAKEDEADVGVRRRLVLDENARREFPLSNKRIRWLTRHRKRELKRVSFLQYYVEMFGQVNSKHHWDPIVDKQAILKSLASEAIHKEALIIVDLDEHSQENCRRRRVEKFLNEILYDIGKGLFLFIGLIIVGIVLDLLAYIPRTPTMRSARRGLAGLWELFFSETGIEVVVVACVVIVIYVWLVRHLRNKKDYSWYSLRDLRIYVALR